MKAIYLLEGLDCAHCAMKIEKHVSKIPGIDKASVDFVSKRLFTEMQSDDLDAEIIKIIRQIEPEVEVKKVENSHHSHTCSCEGHHDHDHHCHEHHHEQEHCHHEHHDHEGHGCCCGHDHQISNEQHKEIKNAEKVYVKGLDCPNCATKVEAYVANMDNVDEASLNFSNGVLFIKLKDLNKKEDTLQKIISVIPTLEDGVSVELEKKVEEVAHPYAMFSFSKNWRLYIGVLLFIIGVFVPQQSLKIIILLVSYLIVGGKVVYTALKNVIRGEIFDENFLMSIATIGAFLIQEYTEAVAVMVFYEIGEMFQSYAVQHSRRSITSLMNIRAEYANVMEDGKYVKKQPEDVHVEDVIMVKPGERVPLDGVVIDGESSIDTSALTGESMPQDISKDDEILAGVVNLNGVLTIRVMKEYSESSVSRILELVENSSSKKAPMEKFVTKFARVYTPAVVGLALAFVILPPLFIKDLHWADLLGNALTFLVVSCPCALVVSIPLGLFAGIGKASKEGILIKGGNYLEALKNVDTVVFDKTGTLTKGKFTVSEVYSVEQKQDELLELAAYGESFSSHPIANSIKDAYAKTIDTSRISHYEEVAGNGIHAIFDGKELLVGNEKFMKKQQFEIANVDSIATIVHVAYDHKYCGYITIEDKVKETSAQTIRDLKNRGIKNCCMLSGDRQEVGDAVAKELSLDEVHMQLLPNQKVEIVEQLLNKEDESKKLVFVGDGINDAPVLARADIGVAMGGVGSDAAIEASDIVLMKDDPYALVKAIDISKFTMRILWQNVIFSLGIKIGVLILAALGIANMWMGVFADVGVTLLAVLNSMRILKMK